MLFWITLMLIYSLFNFYSLFKTHSYVLFFIFIYKNLVNICMINDLMIIMIISTHDPPAHNRNAIFLLLDPWIIRIVRGYNRHLRITSTHTPYWFRHCCTRFTQTLFAVCMQSSGLRMLCRSSMDSFWFHTGRPCSLLLIHGFTTNTTFIHYFEFKSKHCYWKCFFSIVIFFYQSIVSQSFIDVSKCKKYKQCIIQCVYF